MNKQIVLTEEQAEVYKRWMEASELYAKGVINEDEFAVKCDGIQEVMDEIYRQLR